LEALHLGEIEVPEDRVSACRFAEVGTAEVSTAEVGTVEVGPAEVGTVEVGPPAEGSLAEDGHAEVGLDQDGPADVGPVEEGPAQVGLDEDGPAEVVNLLVPLSLSPLIPLADAVRPALEQSDGLVAVHGVAPSADGGPSKIPAPAHYFRAGAQARG